LQYIDGIIHHPSRRRPYRLQPTLAITPGPNRARGERHRLPRIQTLLVDHSIISGNVGNVAFVNFQCRSLAAGDSSGESRKP
jgi:hypothetical protein